MPGAGPASVWGGRGQPQCRSWRDGSVGSGTSLAYETLKSTMLSRNIYHFSSPESQSHRLPMMQCQRNTLHWLNATQLLELAKVATNHPLYASVWNLLYCYLPFCLSLSFYDHIAIVTLLRSPFFILRHCVLIGNTYAYSQIYLWTYTLCMRDIFHTSTQIDSTVGNSR